MQELLRAYNDGPSFGHTPKVVEVCLVLSPLPVEGEEEGKLVWFRAACLYIINSFSYLGILVDYTVGLSLSILSAPRRIPERLFHFLPSFAQQAIFIGKKGIMLRANSFYSGKYVGRDHSCSVNVVLIHFPSYVQYDGRQRFLDFFFLLSVLSFNSLFFMCHNIFYECWFLCYFNQTLLLI